jgi:hypothetical protein
MSVSATGWQEKAIPSNINNTLPDAVISAQAVKKCCPGDVIRSRTVNQPALRKVPFSSSYKQFSKKLVAESAANS